MNESVPSKQLMQKMNRLRVLDEIKRADGITRPVLASITGLSLASITNIVAYLKSMDIVSEKEVVESNQIGRKASLLRYKYSGYDIICIKIGASEFKIVLTDLEGKEKCEIERYVFDKGSSFNAEHLKAEIKKFTQTYATDTTLAIGIAVSGLVLSDGEYILSAGLKWEVSYLKQQIEQDIGLPVLVFNISASSALFSCTSTNSSKLDNVVFVDLDGGVGAIQICNGRVNHAAIGEIGHTTVEKDGELCFCGNRGCLELMCSPECIIVSAQNVTNKKGLSLADVFEIIKSDDSVRHAVDDCLEYLGIAVANVVNIFLPKKIIINYSELDGFDYVNEYVMNCVKRRVHNALSGNIDFELVSIGDGEKLKGIAQYISDTIFDVSFPRNIIE